MDRSALMRRHACLQALGMDEITRMQADVLKVLASPARLEILHLLANGPLEVSRIAAAIGSTQPNASQHLAVLRTAGLVEADRHGREIHYALTDADVIVACGVMRRVLERRLARLAHLAAHAQPITQLGPAT
jgi:DNA-binding transcriptional ArsR family regulator